MLVATIVSYVLNREWSFRTRGGRERHHEAALFFLISGVGVAVYTAPLAISRYVLDLQVPDVWLFTQEIADFVSGQIIGVLAGMAFRWWAFRRFVFPHEDVRRQVPVPTRPDTVDAGRSSVPAGSQRGSRRRRPTHVVGAGARAGRS